MSAPSSDPAPAGPQATAAPWLPLLEAPLRDRGEALLLKAQASGRYTHAQGEVQGVLGLHAAQIVGRTDAELFGATAAALLRAADQTAWDRQGPLASEHALELAGRVRTLRVLRMPVPGPEGGWLGSLWSDPAPVQHLQQRLAQAQGQIEQLQGLNAQLRRELAEMLPRDALSGLHTRSHFEEQLRREIDLSHREQRDFALVRLQVDAPAVPQGLEAADREAVVAAVGRVLKAGTRAMDACCRLEGAGFAVLLSGVGLATAHARTEALRRQCATQMVMHGGRELRMTVSAGVASFPHTAAAAEPLRQACEAALQQALERGGNQVALARVRFGR